MRLSRVYVDSALSVGHTIKLDSRAHHHLAHVLRLQPGQRLRVFNGQGGEYEGTLARFDNKSSAVVIDRFIECHREAATKTRLLQGISRSDHMHFTLQKTVELGVHEIFLILTRRGTVKLDASRIEKKMQHWKQIVIAACEQCGRTYVPKLYPPITLSEYFLNRPPHFGVVLEPTSNNSLSELVPDLKNITLLVGAEGGLTEEEIALATENGFQTIRLGPRILRTETAGITALAAVQTLWGDLAMPRET